MTYRRSHFLLKILRSSHMSNPNMHIFRCPMDSVAHMHALSHHSLILSPLNGLKQMDILLAKPQDLWEQEVVLTFTNQENLVILVRGSITHIFVFRYLKGTIRTRSIIIRTNIERVNKHNNPDNRLHWFILKVNAFRCNLHIIKKV